MYVIVRYLDEGFENLAVFETEIKAKSAINKFIKLCKGKLDPSNASHNNYFEITDIPYSSNKIYPYSTCKLGIHFVPLDGDINKRLSKN